MNLLSIGFVVAEPQMRPSVQSLPPGVWWDVTTWIVSPEISPVGPGI